jgi:D-lactate dehydrogenase
MKIVIYETEFWEREAFESLKGDHELAFIESVLSERNASQNADAEIISTFIYSEVTPAVLKKLTNLKMIATRSTGYDHVDLDYCRQAGIVVCNVPTYGCHTVAEHVFGLLLTISHHVVDAVNRTRRGEFSFKGLEGFDLHDKTMGIVGTGEIGECVVKIANGFGMRIIAFDPKPKEALVSDYGLQYTTFDTLLAESDIITLHVPGTDKTYHMISSDEFSKMKDGVILINTARGSVVDTPALVTAISDQKVAAVGLDVLAAEPVIREEAELLRSAFQDIYDTTTLLADHILLRLRNVFITPHSAFYTREAVGRILEVSENNIQAFIRGERLNEV